MTGKQEILAEEALGLAYYYGVSLEYLFSPNLNIFCDVPAAYLRWYDKNKQKKEESERYEKIEFINRKLRERPYLVDFMKKAVAWSEEQLQQTIDYLNSRKIS